MTVTLAPWTPEHNDDVRALAAEPTIAPQFEQILGPGRLEYWLADPFCSPGLRYAALADGAVVGFAYGFLLASSAEPWTILRAAVSPAHRRRGIGTRLFEAQCARLPELMPGCRETCIAAYEPSPATRGFAERHGFRIVRTFWLMQRNAPELAEPVWPAGITTRVLDETETSLAAWNDAYNLSFARHYHFTPSTVDEVRAIAAATGFDRASVLLAFDGEACVGFCRNDVYPGRGEIAGLGVAPVWQGRGLGRALLRWGAHWLRDRGALPITLLVDGENENALRLYRGEGFEIAKTRPNWSRPWPPR